MTRKKKFNEESVVVGIRVPKSKVGHFKRFAAMFIKKYYIKDEDESNEK